MPRLSYVGIKQIGSYWFSKKDNYRKKFDTADECSKHFNEVEEPKQTKNTNNKKRIKNAS